MLFCEGDQKYYMWFGSRHVFARRSCRDATAGACRTTCLRRRCVVRVRVRGGGGDDGWAKH